MSVEKGWSGFEEVNRVVYDPAKVNLEQLEEWLQESETYVRTVSGPEKDIGYESGRK